MRRRVLLVLVAACALAYAGLALADGTFTITLTDDGPQPAIATVQIGDTVSFVAAGSQNHAIFGPGFTVPFLRPGESSSVRMVTAGTFKYRATGFYKPSGGLIVVTVPTPPVLSASKTTILFHQAVTLKGTSPLRNYEIGLESKPMGRGVHAAWTRTSSLPTGADGSFSTVVYPEGSTAYRVRLGARSASDPVAVGVAPVLTLSATPRSVKAGRPVRVVAKVQPASAASQLLLSVYDRTRPPASWRDVGKASVASNGTAVFSWTATAGKTLLRVHSTRATAGGTFVSGTSTSIVVNVSGKAPARPSQRSPKKPQP
jgi:hypothetical protein